MQITPKELFQLPNELKDYMGVVYILQLSNNTIKIGATINPLKRIKTHITNLKIYSDRRIKVIYITIPHTNYQKNETKLKRLFVHNKIGGETFKITLDEAITRLSSFKFKDETERLVQEGDEFLTGMKNFFAEQ